MISYEGRTSEQIKRINREIIEQGGPGLVPNGYIIGYNPSNDTFICFRDLDIDNIKGENYRD